MQAYQLVRKDAPQTSKDAAEKVALTLNKMRVLVLQLVKDAGSDGITSKEIAEQNLHLSNSTCTARPSELERMGLIFYKGDKRDGARVIRAIEYKEDEQPQTIEQLELGL